MPDEPLFYLTAHWRKTDADGQTCVWCEDEIYLNPAWEMAIAVDGKDIGKMNNIFLCASCKEQNYGRCHGNS